MNVFVAENLLTWNFKQLSFNCLSPSARQVATVKCHCYITLQMHIYACSWDCPASRKQFYTFPYIPYLFEQKPHPDQQPHACANTIKWAWPQSYDHWFEVKKKKKNMAENILGLILLLIYRSSISNIRKSVLKTSIQYQCHQGVSLQINKSHPRLVAALQQGLN